MKTAISVPNELFREAERHAKRTRKSRSQLYSEAMAEYLARHDHDAVTEAMNRVADAIDTSLDPGLAAAARDVLRKVEW
jgi:metal-responsive CopG/Arc/MetJ family transcriptional regulator